MQNHEESGANTFLAQAAESYGVLLQQQAASAVRAADTGEMDAVLARAFIEAYLTQLRRINSSFDHQATEPLQSLEDYLSAVLVQDPSIRRGLQQCFPDSISEGSTNSAEVDTNIDIESLHSEHSQNAYDPAQQQHTQHSPRVSSDQTETQESTRSCSAVLYDFFSHKPDLVHRTEVPVVPKSSCFGRWTCFG